MASTSATQLTPTMTNSSASLVEMSRQSSKPASAGGLRPPSNATSFVGERSTSRVESEIGSRQSRKSASAVGMRSSSNGASGISLRPPSNVASAVGSQTPSGNTESTLSSKTAGNSKSVAMSRAPSSAATAVGLKVPSNGGSGTGLRPSSNGGSGTGLRPPSNAASAAGSRVPSAKASVASSLRPPASVRASSPAAGSSSQSQRKEALKGDEDFAEKIVTMSKDHVEELSSANEAEGGDASAADDDIFAPTDERVQTIDFSRIRSQSIQITKNEHKRKANVLESLKKQVRNFFHEDRAGQVTDEQGNVELPMDPCIQARDDHDSGLLPHQRLFRLARYEQLQLRDRNLQHQRPRHHLEPGEGVDDYEFAWIVKRVSQSVAPSDAERRSHGVRSIVGLDAPDGVNLKGDDGNDSDGSEGAGGEAHRTTGNTYRSKVGTGTVEFKQRINLFVRPVKQESVQEAGEGQCESEQEKARRAQLLSLCGLVAAPTLDALSPEERKMLEDFLEERARDSMDGSDERYPCDCCGPQAAPGIDTSNRAATCYDILFAHRKNVSFTVRFDLVHCLPRFVLHYKFHKQLYDCLDASERLDLVKVATDITTSYSLGHCTLQLPYGKYRTNAYASLFAYIIVPDHLRYLEIFEVCNPPVRQGDRQKKKCCIVPNWPDKSYVTEFWTYSKESTNTSDKDPRLESKLYEKNVLRKLQLVQMPELQVTRRNPPSELTVTKRKTHSRLGDFDLFEDFALILHQDQPMLGFGSVNHPSHATDSRSPQPDMEFLDRLLQAMCAYVRRFVNTRQRRLAGREDLSCTVNLSLHHSYAFRGHQRVYGFVGFPRASTYWGALVEEQRRNATLAEAAVTQEDIRVMRAASRTPEGAAAATDVDDDGNKGDDADTETSADRTEVDEADGALEEKLKSCSLL